MKTKLPISSRQEDFTKCRTFEVDLEKFFARFFTNTCHLCVAGSEAVIFKYKLKQTFLGQRVKLDHGNALDIAS